MRIWWASVVESGLDERRKALRVAGKTTDRVYLFDNLKGLLIALVVTGHLIEPMANAGNHVGMAAFDFIYLFHMPLFIFVTGLFSKSCFKNGKYRAEVPVYYFVLCTLMFLGLFLERRLLGANMAFDLVTMGGGMAPWYLMAAGFYVLAVPFFARLKPSVAIGASILIALYAGTRSSTDFFAMSRIVNFLPFFLLGFYLDSRWLADKFSTSKSGKRRGPKVGALITSILVLIVAAVAFSLMGEDWLTFFRRLFTARNSYEVAIHDGGFCFSRWFALGARLCWYFVVVLIGLALLRLLPVGKSRFLGLMGNRSLQIYFFHPFITYLCSRFGLVSVLQSVVPDGSVLVALVVLGFLLAYVLALPGAVQRAFNALKAKIAAWVDDTESSAGMLAKRSEGK